MKNYFINKRKLVYFKQWNNKKYAAFNSFKKVIKICTLALAYSIITKPVSVKAQGSDTTNSRIYELDEVTVQSTLIELKNAETGRSIEIINGAQLQNLPVTTIDELLRYVPGIDAQQRGAFGAQTDFSLRGSNFNQVLILIDGQKINDPLTSHFNSNIPVSPSEIERIEIIRGPASLEYGPDAIGGVINIITKTFSKNPQPANFNANAKVQKGQFDLLNTDGGIFYGSDKIRLSGGFLLNKSDGNPLMSGLKNFFDINTLSVSGQYKLNHSWSISYRYARDYRDFNAQWYYSTSLLDSSTEKTIRDQHQFQLSGNYMKSSTVLSAAFIKTNDYYNFNSKISFVNYTWLSTVKFIQNYDLSEFLRISGGIDFDQKSITSDNRGNHSLNHFGVFSLFSILPSTHMHLNAGLRMHYNDQSGAFFLPQVSYSCNLNQNILLRAALGLSIREPDFTELYYNNYISAVSAMNRIGNRDLKVEKSWNEEIGTDFNFINKTILNLTIFNRNIKDQIDYVLTNQSAIPNLTNLVAGANYWYAINNSKVVTNGVEANLSRRFNFTKEFSSKIILGYTFTNIKADYNEPANPYYLSLHSRHLLNTEFELSYKILNWNIEGNYKIREHSQVNTTINSYLKKEYAVWNTSVDIAVYKHQGFLTLSVFNIFDINYSDFIGAEMPGRWIAGGIKFKL